MAKALVLNKYYIVICYYFLSLKVKNTLWEGGVRGSGLLWSPLLKKRSRLAQQLMNVQDWLPTLYSIAGSQIFEKIITY